MKFKYIVKNVARAAGKTVDVHAEADLRGQRLGHALPPGALEGRRAAVLRRGRLRAACPTPRATTSAACSSTRRRCWPSPTRRRTPTAAWCRATRRRSTWSTRQRNRSACCRIPITGANPKAKRIEFRVPDPSCNPYLAFAAMLMAGLDGIRNKIEPPEPVDKDLYELPPDAARAGPAGAGLARGGARRARGGPRVPARGRRLHAGRDRDLDRLQARERGRPDPPPPAPATSSSSTTTSERTAARPVSPAPESPGVLGRVLFQGEGTAEDPRALPVQPAGSRRCGSGPAQPGQQVGGGPLDPRVAARRPQSPGPAEGAGVEDPRAARGLVDRAVLDAVLPVVPHVR